MDVYEAIGKRRSIRLFKEDPVPAGVLEKCLNTGRLAASAGNQQVLEFIAISDAELLPKVFETVGMVSGYSGGKVRAEFSRQPKAYIVTLINQTLDGPQGYAEKYGNMDAACACTNIMLAAVAEGLASCPILMVKEPKLRELLNIPGNYEINLVLALGYADEESVTEPVTGTIAYEMDDKGIRHVPKRALADIAHWNGF